MTVESSSTSPSSEGWTLSYGKLFSALAALLIIIGTPCIAHEYSPFTADVIGGTEGALAFIAIATYFIYRRYFSSPTPPAVGSTPPLTPLSVPSAVESDGDPAPDSPSSACGDNNLPIIISSEGKPPIDDNSSNRDY